MDSGASSHMTPAREDFFEYEKLREAIQVRAVDGAIMSSIGQGSIRFRCKNGTAVTVNEVLCIPTLDRRLLAVHKIVQRGHNVRFWWKILWYQQGQCFDDFCEAHGKCVRSRCGVEHAMLVEHEDAGKK